MRKNLEPFLAAGILLAAASYSFAQSNTPKAAVEAFYRFDRAHSQVFNRRNIDARRQWLSSELYSLFLTELRRQSAFEKTNPDEKPYFGDGLPFQPYDETCKVGRRELHRVVTVARGFQRGNRAAVTASFHYPRPCTDRDRVTYTFGLTRAGDRWLIDDVNYGEDTTLKQRLKRKEY